MRSSGFQFGMAFFLFLILLAGSDTLSQELRVTDSVNLPAGTLTADELRHLFSDKTVYSVTAVTKRESVSYYAPDGEFRQMRNGIRRTGRWRITENDRMCLQMESLPEKCRIIVKDGEQFKKYIVKKNGRHQHSVSYVRFVDGNPLGL